MPQMSDQLLILWTDYSGTLPDVQNVVSVHAPDVRSTSNAASTSFCQGKCLKNETDHRLYQLTAGQAEAGAITSLIYW